VITLTWTDPCPRCGAEVTAFDIEPEYVRDNPEAVLTLPNPLCPTNEDPDAECICLVLVNPAADPLYDQFIAVAVTVTMHPCDHAIRAPLGGDGQRGRKLGGLLAGWKIYRQEVPEPGSLGELMADWAQAADDD
jgi:hypothetical protein